MEHSAVEVIGFTDAHFLGTVDIVAFTMRLAFGVES
jgi:hypothetical protein